LGLKCCQHRLSRYRPFWPRSETRPAWPGHPDGGAGTAGAHQTNYQDRLFAQLAAAGGAAEVEFGKLAKRSGNSTVTAFAGRMVEDHSAANTRLKSLAEANKIPLPEWLDEEHEWQRAELEKLDGVKFDIAYISGQITDHQKTVQLLE
jgi:putative membrane protein